MGARHDDLRHSPLGSWLLNDRTSWAVAPVWPVLDETYAEVVHVLSRSESQGSGQHARRASTAFLRSVANDVAQLTSRAVAQDATRNRSGGPTADWPAAISGRYQERSSAAGFLTRHPVLHERLLHVLALHVNSLQLMLDRLSQDMDDLRALCGATSARLRRVVTMGDLHRRGSVLLLEFRSGSKAMYKPRSLGVEIALSPLLGHLASSDDGIRIVVPASIDREDYGWQRYVESTPVKHPASAGRFYRNAGGLVAAAHLLGGVDLHCDNVLCVDEVPTVLDAECFFNAPAGQSATLEGYEDTADSILATGLLPAPNLPEGIPDTTTLGSFGIRQARRQITLPVTAADGSLRLREYRLPPFLPPQLPSREGQPIPPTGHEAEITEGFRRTYAHFMTCAECRRFVLRLPSTLDRARVRHVVRPTAVYARMLRALSDGRAAMSSTKANEYVDHLSSDGTRGRVTEGILSAERDALRAGYVPLFERQAHGRDVAVGTGSAVDVLPFSGIDLAIMRMEKLSSEDMKRHLALLRRSLTSVRGCACLEGSAARTAAVHARRLLCRAPRPAAGGAGGAGESSSGC